MERKELAFEITKKIRRLLLDGFEKITHTEEKTSEDYVTNIDFESEKVMIEAIQKRFPKDTIISEEEGTLEGSTRYKWILDPLDGTNNYLRGIPQAGMQIAILRDDIVIFGLLLDAFNNIVYYAEKGKGAFKTDTTFNKKTKLRVSERSLDKSLVIVSSSILKDKTGGEIKTIKKMLPKMGSIRIYGVAIKDLPFIAQGSAEVLISFIPKSMDITAGSLLIEEAGGKVTTFDGACWYPDMPNFLATNRKVHKQILGILGKH